MHDETLSDEIQAFLADTFLISFGSDVGARVARRPARPCHRSNPSATQLASHMPAA